MNSENEHVVEMEQPHFVWILTPIGAQAQKWAALDYGDRDRLKPYVIAHHPLSQDEMTLSIDELSIQYPLEPRAQ